MGSVPDKPGRRFAVSAWTISSVSNASKPRGADSGPDRAVLNRSVVLADPARSQREFPNVLDVQQVVVAAAHDPVAGNRILSDVVVATVSERHLVMCRE